MSARAALLAIEKGMTNVAALEGGWAAWLRAGYPVEGQPAATPTPTEVVQETGGAVAVLGSPDAPVTMVEFSDYQ